tara:strand:+ start:153 stop:281 length:129 start_codon:yes stop_codon:yes gene_type:complete
LAVEGSEPVLLLGFYLEDCRNAGNSTVAKRQEDEKEEEQDGE